MKVLWEQKWASERWFLQKKKMDKKMAKMSKSKDREHRKRETETERSKQYMWLLD